MNLFSSNDKDNKDGNSLIDKKRNVNDDNDNDDNDNENDDNNSRSFFSFNNKNDDNGKKNKKNDKNKNNWKRFFSVTLHNLIYVIIFGIIGSNFIYFSTISKDVLNKFFPTDIKLPFYNPLLSKKDDKKDSNPSKNITPSSKKVTPSTKNITPSTKNITPSTKNIQKGGSYTCSAPKLSSGDKVDTFKKLEQFGYKDNSFPYNLMTPAKDDKSKDDKSKEDRKKDFGTLQGFKNWFGETTRDSFVFERKILKKFISFFEPTALQDPKNKKEANTNLLSWQPLQMLVGNLMIGGIVTSIIPMIMGVITFITSFMVDWIWALAGLFLIYNLIITFGLTLVQTFQLFVTFTILPVFTNTREIKNIFACNKQFLAIIFGLMTISTAFGTLESSTATMMTVCYAYLVYKMMK